MHRNINTSKHLPKYIRLHHYVLIIWIIALSACTQLSPLDERVTVPNSDFSIRIPEGYEARDSEGMLRVNKLLPVNIPHPRFLISYTRLGKMPGDTLENRLGPSLDDENVVKSSLNGFDVYFWYEGGTGDELSRNEALLTDGKELLSIQAFSSADYAEEAQRLLNAMVQSVEQEE